jgi:hypothetical protein
MSKRYFILLLMVGTSFPARAGIDAPGSIHFHWLAEEETVYSDYPEIPPDAERFHGRAYFNSEASRFGSDGVYIWGGFDLVGPAGRGYGMLLLDLDLTMAPLDGETPMPHGAIRAEYIETWEDQVLFEGEAVVGDVWIIDVLFHQDDEGAVEGDFAFVFADPRGVDPGCRVFLDGQFITDPSPGSLREKYGVPDDVEVGYVSHGCSGDFYVADGDPDGCDCGGEDPDASGGCEGDTADGSDCSGCEGDTGGGCDGGGGGCEGDVGGGCSGSGGGCSGGGGAGCSGGGGGACAAATAGLRARGAPLRGVMKFLPEMVVLVFIGRMRRRYGE